MVRWNTAVGRRVGNGGACMEEYHVPVEDTAVNVSTPLPASARNLTAGLQYSVATVTAVRLIDESGAGLVFGAGQQHVLFDLLDDSNRTVVVPSQGLAPRLSVSAVHRGSACTGPIPVDFTSAAPAARLLLQDEDVPCFGKADAIDLLDCTVGSSAACTALVTATLARPMHAVSGSFTINGAVPENATRGGTLALVPASARVLGGAAGEVQSDGTIGLQIDGVTWTGENATMAISVPIMSFMGVSGSMNESLKQAAGHAISPGHFARTNGAGGLATAPHHDADPLALVG